MDENNRNFILAIVLSIGVLFAWQYYFVPKHPVLVTETAEQQQTEQQTEQGPPQPPGGGEVQSGGAPQPGPSAAPTPTREAALAQSPRIAIETPSLRGSIALKGGRIDDLVLAKYHETVEPSSPNVVLFSPSGSPEPYYAEYGWVSAAGAALPVPDRETVWTVEKGSTLTPDTPVTLAWDNGKGVVFRRTIAVDADYLFTVTDEVENKSAGEIALHPYALISRHGMPKVEGYYILHEGPIGVVGDAGLQEISFTDAIKDGGTKTFKQTGGWLGMTDKYWAAALVPDQKAPYEAALRGAKASGLEKDRFRPTTRSAP